MHRTRPGVRPRDIAASLDITERGAYGIVTSAGVTAVAGLHPGRVSAVAGIGAVGGPSAI